MADETVLVLHRKSANEERVKEAIKQVKREGYQFRVLVPFNKREKPRVVMEALARGARRIIAGGGDGTLNAVADAILDGEREPLATTLGILPLGTANDFARGCDLPADDLTACLRIACEREGKIIDVGELNGRHFINVASAGFGAEITAGTSPELKKVLGGAAYTLMGLVKATQLTPYTGQLTLPDGSTARGSILFMAVGNNRLAGGGFNVAPLAKLDDGLLDLAVIRWESGMNMARLPAELADPLNPANEILYYRQLSHFEIRSDEKLHCNLDGEPMLKKKYRFRALPGRLKLAL